MYCYMITNKINQKKYIGITIDFEKRMAQHKRQKTSSLIHQAIQKYGFENFKGTKWYYDNLPNNIPNKLVDNHDIWKDGISDATKKLIDSSNELKKKIDDALEQHPDLVAGKKASVAYDLAKHKSEIKATKNCL